jgi:hypothetical protein
MGDSILQERTFGPKTTAGTPVAHRDATLASKSAGAPSPAHNLARGRQPLTGVLVFLDGCAGCEPAREWLQTNGSMVGRPTPGWGPHRPRYVDPEHGGSPDEKVEKPGRRCGLRPNLPRHAVGDIPVDAVECRLQAPRFSRQRPASLESRRRCGMVRGDGSGVLVGGDDSFAERASKKRCSASREVQRVPPTCSVSRTMPRHPPVAQRKRVETWVLRPRRRRGRVSAAFVREISSSRIESITAVYSGTRSEGISHSCFHVTADRRAESSLVSTDCPKWFDSNA